jgi:hypothetical protein
MQAPWSMARASADVTMVVYAGLTNPLILLVPPAGIGPAAHGLGIRNPELSALLKINNLL